jgi:hypothetical protein
MSIEQKQYIKIIRQGNLLGDIQEKQAKAVSGWKKARSWLDTTGMSHISVP